MLGTDSGKPTSRLLSELVSWVPTINGDIHPQLCADCGEVLTRTPIDSEFRLARRFDISSTYDGWIIVSEKAQLVLKQILVDLSFTAIDRAPGFFVLDTDSVPIVSIDEEASGIRRDCRCELCGADGETLLGLLESPPRPKTLVLNNDCATTQLAIGDIYFGTSFLKSPYFFVTQDAYDQLNQAGLSGVEMSSW